MPNELMKHLDKSMKYLHRQGALLTVADEKGHENVMTISWGNIGFEWGRPVFTILVRRSRYTHKLLETAKEFTVSIPTSPELRKALVYAGTKSGADIDKFDTTELTRVKSNKVAVSHIKEADIIYECKIIYKHKLDPNGFVGDVNQTSYLEGDYHDIYYGEIVDLYTNEENK